MSLNAHTELPFPCVCSHTCSSLLDTLVLTYHNAVNNPRKLFRVSLGNSTMWHNSPTPVVLDLPLVQCRVGVSPSSSANCSVSSLLSKYTFILLRNAHSPGGGRSFSARKQQVLWLLETLSMNIYSKAHWKPTLMCGYHLATCAT